jgi:hypothetical protein
VRNRFIIRSVINAGLLALSCAVVPVSAQESRSYPSDALCKREQLCRGCNGPACMKVASPTTWPEDRVEEGAGPFIVGAVFKVSLPKGASFFLVAADGTILAKYGPDRWVSLQVPTAAQAQRPQWDGRNGTRPNALTFADIPHIQHWKTPEDAEPTHMEDRRVWRYALVGKSIAFKGATQLTVAERGALTVYMSDARVAGNTTVAYVTHKRLKDSYLHVQAKGFSLDDVLRVIGSIEAVRE